MALPCVNVSNVRAISYLYQIKAPMRKIAGWTFVIFGFIALITPLTPGGLLFFVGLELLGLRFIGTEKLKRFLMKEKELPVLDTITIDTPPHTIHS